MTDTIDAIASKHTPWMTNLIAMLKDGGTWICPCTKSIFTFHKEDMTYEFTGDETDDTNRISICILEDKMGYTRVF